LPAAPTASAGQRPTPTDPGSTPQASRPPRTTDAPEPTEAVPVTRLRLFAIGLEDPASPDAVDRVIAFTSDSGQQIRIEVTAVSVGDVELCTQDEASDGECLTGSDVALDMMPMARDWQFVLRGATEGVAATVDLDIRFPATAPVVGLRGFRLSGVTGGANGLTAEFNGRAGGPIRFEATWPTPADWLLTIVGRGDPAAPTFDASGDGTSTSASVSTQVAADERYRLEFTSPTGTEEVHFDATVSLP
jgi:hypothetical protein